MVEFGSVLHRVIGVGLLFGLVPCMPLNARDIKNFSHEITSDRAEFVIEVGGTLDPENIEITIENLGNTAVEDPRITVNGKYDWFDEKSIVKEATEGCTTDEEKALAIWEFVLHKRYQRSPQDLTDLSPVRGLNCYGYGICGHTAAWLKGLWTAAGLDARVQEIYGHTVNEVFYDGAWRYMDGNSKVFYLGRDNRTPASLAEVERDGELIMRTLHGGDVWERQMSPIPYLKERVRIVTSAEDNYVDTGYDKEIFAGYTMSSTLRPGESLTRWWKPVLNKYNARHLRPEVPSVYANGRLVWEPDLDKVDVYDFLNIHENITTRVRTGNGPGIQCEKLQSPNYARVARFTMTTESPYPIVGARFFSTVVKEGNTGMDEVSIYWERPELGGGNPLYRFRWFSGEQDVELDLDYKILEETQAYSYNLGFSLRGNADTVPPTNSGLNGFRLVTDLQVSPHSLPALSLGKNVIRYRDSSPAPGKKVRISWKWRENADNRPPSSVGKPISPGIGETVSSLSPVLRWQAASDPDDSVADYQVLVSLRPDARWPVSPTLHQNLGGAATEWKVPDGFLNPGTAYYWKVRARDSRGAVGQWSEVFSFRTSAGASSGPGSVGSR